MSKPRIMLAGPSGIGKTTLAKILADKLKIPFISGSMSDLLPDTKTMKHSDMLGRDPKTLQEEEYKVLGLRNKLFSQYQMGEGFISDRSYLDSITYFTYKLADKIPACEVEHFHEICKELLVTQCTHLIVIDFTPEMVRSWTTEDNNKRITSNYFQYEISSLMDSILDLDAVIEHCDTDNYYGKLVHPKGDINILWLETSNLQDRVQHSIDFIL